MTTVAIKPGGTGPLAVRFADEAGEAIRFKAVQLRIQAGAQCIVLNGDNYGDHWRFRPSAMGLPVRAYRATLYTDAGQGWRQGGEFIANIKGGC